MSFYPSGIVFITLAFLGILSIAALIVILIILIRKLTKKKD